MYIVIFFAAVFIGILSFGSIRQYTAAKIFLVFLLAIFAGTRAEGIDNDYFEYARLFLLYEDFSLEGLAEKEISFFLIPGIGSFFFSNQGIVYFSFLTFAFLAIALKLRAFSREHFFLNLSLYCSYWFFTQDMTTIRAGVACGIFMLAISDLYKEKYNAYLFKVILALLFHYSSILFLITYFLLRFRVKLMYYYLMLCVSFGVVVLKMNVLTLLGLNVVFPKVQIYLDLLEKVDGEPVNIFNFRILLSIVITILFWLKFTILKDNKMFMILFKIHILSLVVFFMLSPTAMVFSLRTYDMLSVVQILLYPYILYLVKEKFIGYLIIFAICGVNLFYVFQISGWFKDYSSWIFN